MYAEATGFDRAELVRTVRAAWGIRLGELGYEPVGFGTHHYRAVDAQARSWFINVDEVATKPWLGSSAAEAFAGLDAALATAAGLREAGLEFVHAPLRRPDGSCLAAMPGGYGVSLSPLIDGTAHPFGDFPDERLRRRMLTALGRLHATPSPVATTRRDTLTVPERAELDQILDNLDEDWAGGPYAEAGRELLRTHGGAVTALLRRYDELVPAVLSTSDRWVVTHGEPHAGNVMLTRAGGLRLIDWDTVAIGPPERDLSVLEPGSPADWAAYALAERADPAALQLYRLRWPLADIASFATWLRGPHADDENTRVALRGLRGHLEGGA